jgi:uncharacterized membrane protein
MTMSTVSSIRRPAVRHGHISRSTIRQQDRQPPLTTRPKTDRGNETPFVNVGDAERMLSAIGGGALALYGLSRGTLGGLCLAGIGGCLVYRGMSGHCDLYGAMGVSTTSEQAALTSVEAGSGCKVEKSIRINRPADDLYLYWTNFENLPNIMSHLKSVKKIDGRRSRWVAKAPLGMSVEWEAEVHTARPNELISWRSLPGSQVDTAGSVHFKRTADGRATDVRVVLKYDPPAGKMGSKLAGWLGQDPERQIDEDLNQFKTLMEAGEKPASPARR